MKRDHGIRSIDEGEFRGKRVLLRVDINSPIDRKTGRIANDNRIRKSVPTIKDLSDMGARLTLIAHQGDSTDYRSLISLREHAHRLADLLVKPVFFIEDVAGPEAAKRIESLKDGEILLLDNLRYLTEEVSTFEDSVKLSPDEMGSVYLIRRLAPLFDCYVNDAFSAAHRGSPSMVGFEKRLPSYGGRLLLAELAALRAITKNPRRPCVFMLGGSRAGDAFGMIKKVLDEKAADCILTSGLVGHIFMMADGRSLGGPSKSLIIEKGYGKFIENAKEYLTRYGEIVRYPLDVAYGRGNRREEALLDELPVDALLFDIGERTIAEYSKVVEEAKTVFVNGPSGVYEEDISSRGTKALWKAVELTGAYTVVGGGDTVTSFTRFTDPEKIDYVSTAGGALIRYLSGAELPLLTALREGM
ncbi:MAG: phosphoglycerate kinase [Spirochaetes bacterium]|nr:phosphoglycerate kinase [Spirochaetota bacterium]